MENKNKEKQLSEEELKDVSGGFPCRIVLGKEEGCVFPELNENKPNGNAQDQEKAIIKISGPY